MSGYYPLGAENDPRAPYNQKDDDWCEEDEDEDFSIFDDYNEIADKEAQFKMLNNKQITNKK